jgi:hypothetical protein
MQRYSNSNSHLEEMEEEFQDQMRRRYGDPSSGKKHTNHHGSKTSKFIKEEQYHNAQHNRSNSAEERIFHILAHFPDFESKDLEDRFIDNYLKWLKNCFLEKKLIMDPKTDFELKFNKSSSNGGQNVNKTETAVRITHVITNLQVKNEEFRDQTDNRKEAFKIMLEKLKQHLVDWKEYLGQKDIKEVSRYDILELMEQAILETKRI